MKVYLQKRSILFLMVFTGALFAFGLSYLLTSAEFGKTALAEPVGQAQRTDSGHLAYITSVLEKSRTGLSDVQERSLAAVILEESRANSIDPLLIMAIIETESTYYNRARSHKGAIGLMQIMPDTGVWVAGLLDVDWKGTPTLYDPLVNVRLGTRYFSMLRKRFDNDTFVSLAAYNAGPTRVSARIRRGNNPPARYADKVLKSYKGLKENFRDLSA